MHSNRRAGAPRLIEWTGERCVPWAPDPQVIYEHLHRYFWARQFATGKRVLDLASGEGFGAAILAEVASHVVAIDLDPQTVEHSRLNYGGIDFQLGDAHDLSRFSDGTFDLVVAFEMIEHVPDQERVLGEARRVLGDQGILVMSTPDRSAYSDATGQQNPFHVHELTAPEFRDLLRQSFATVELWAQRAVEGSAMSPITRRPSVPSAVSWFIERQGEDWQEQLGLSPMYVLALASNGDLPSVSDVSTLSDGTLSMLRNAEAEAEEALRAAQDRHSAELLSQLDAKRELHAAENLRYETESQRQKLEARESETKIRELSETVRDRSAELENRQRRVRQLQEELSAQAADSERVAQQLQNLEQELNELRRVNRRVTESVLWQTLQRLRSGVYGMLGGDRSIPSRAIQLALRGAGRAVVSPRAEPAPIPEAPASGSGTTSSVIEFPSFERPRASLVIPVYRHAQLTRSCLESIRDNTSHASYEVILVDDGADEATKEVLGAVRGAKQIVNRSNIGYAQSVLAGVAASVGEWLVLCNNDIEVQPGWLQAMLDCADADAEVGVVTPKYLSPNGAISEAGAIIWRDGTGWNYGRGHDRDASEYSFRREVDYGSAAALLVRKSLWDDIGGFDERFAPMYYEDVDLCFEARERGLKVLYEPRAEVIHVEGASAGTDTAVGHKRFQELNRPKFVEKWSRQLEADHYAPDPRRVVEASDRRRGRHILIIDHRLPMWDKDAGSLRMLAIVRILHELGCRVTFLPDNLDAPQPYRAQFGDLGVHVLYHPTAAAPRIAAIASEMALVISSRPHTTARWLDSVRGLAPDVPVAYDTVDLHWVREARRAKVSDLTDIAALPGQARALHEIETALVRATDATIVVSEDEARRVVQDVPRASLHVIPTYAELWEKVPGPEGRRGVLFVGGFEHPPNVDAAVFLVKQLMPVVWRTYGDVPVKIVGPSAPDEVVALESRQVEVVGWVPKVDPYLATARLLIAPMTYGAGLKGKVTQALAAGLPVVTTPVGAEGLDAVDGVNMMVADDVAGLAQRIATLLDEDEAWRALSRNGQELADGVCSSKALRHRLERLLDWASLRPPAVTAVP